MFVLTPAYYSHFCCALPLPTVETATAALELYKLFADELVAKNEAVLFVAGKEDTPEPSLWLFSHEDGDPEQVIAFVLRCAERFGLKVYWGFQWIHGSHPPRPDAFSSGALIVDLEKRCLVEEILLQEWLVERIEALRLRARRKLVKTTKAQRVALKRLWKRSHVGSYRRLRERVEDTLGRDGAIAVRCHEAWLCIDPDGHTHA